MKASRIAWIVTVGIVVTSNSPALAATSPYTENFTTTANWSTSSMSLVAPALVAAGGPDGSSYVSRTSSAAGFPNETPFVQFRAHDEFNSSGHAFEGDWIAGGLNQLTVYVRHNAPQALPFFVRFTRPTGGTGVVFETASPLAANMDWTKLTFDISPDSPYFTPEGLPSLFASTMSNVGHVQIGYTVRDGFGSFSDPYTFEMDVVSSAQVPEPASWLLLSGGTVVGFVGRRRRCQ
ncbi:MAG: PEP-CTERM sorting domain-containing protein [Planctomycetes bacterium]|nr:PEP-CTERM sorting domain-containing protein [Planctomycetota bacterium]